MAVHKFTDEDDRHYISLLQENINRMATNSANCKTWLVTILAALMAIQITLQELQGLLWVGLLPNILFFVLDCYYLGLERRFIKIEENFVAKEQNGDDTKGGLYNFKTKAVMGDIEATCGAMKSFSTWPFYGFVAVYILLICLWPDLLGCITLCGK